MTQTAASSGNDSKYSGRMSFDNRLKTHKLKGALNEYHAFSISPSDRIVFRILDDDGVLLVDIGSHDEVY